MWPNPQIPTFGHIYWRNLKWKTPYFAECGGRHRAPPLFKISGSAPGSFTGQSVRQISLENNLRAKTFTKRAGYSGRI